MAGDELRDAANEDLIEILEEGSGRLDIARYVDHVRDLSAGAIATFEGTTRDHFGGKRVVELRYEAYGAMARRRLAAILGEARAAHALRRLAVAHRLGAVPAGEASVFVAASAVHRADAMEACRYVIDEIKASVPIWKKEVYDDGEVWKENREFLDRIDAAAPAKGKGGAGGCCGSKGLYLDCYHAFSFGNVQCFQCYKQNYKGCRRTFWDFDRYSVPARGYQGSYK